MRVARLSAVGVLTHVISNFVDKSWRLTDDTERRMYLTMFARAIQATDWICLAYALMSNHLHFALIPGHDDMERWTKAANSPFAQWLNRRQGRSGPVFAERAEEWVISTSARDLIAYIHNNPVRANVVGVASESTWSSHRAYAGLEEAPSWLHVERGLELSGFSGARDEFNEWVSTCPSRYAVHPDLAAIRAEVRRRGEALEVGTPVLSDDGVDVPLLRGRNALPRVPAHKVLDRTAKMFGLSPHAICSRTTRPDVYAPKRIFIHVALKLGTTSAECARVLGVSPQAVSKRSKQALDQTESAIASSLIAELSAVRDGFNFLNPTAAIAGESGQANSRT